MIIRGARKSDLKFIEDIYREYDFKLEPKHIEMMVIAEDEDSTPIAVMSLNTVLECSFLTSKTSLKKQKVEALKQLVEIGIREVKQLGYDNTHAFSNELIAPILKKHFGFKPANGENLILFV